LEGASSAFDSDDNDLVIFGGMTASGDLSDDTWLWNGKVWHEIQGNQTTAPPPRELAAMVFDAHLHQLILFGGRGKGSHLLDDTWAWNGYSWYQLQGSGPGPREAASMALDSRGDLVLFGGFGYPNPPLTAGDQINPATGAPLRASVLDDTWTWTSAGWVPVSVAGPPARWGATIGYDPRAAVTILLGGQSGAPGAPSKTLGDTWAWNGTTWIDRTEKKARPIGPDPVLIEDQSLDALLLLAGSAAPAQTVGVWERSGGTTWVPLSASGAPPVRGQGIAAFDAGSDSIVYGLGTGSFGGVLGDLWQLVAIPKGSGNPPAATTLPPATTLPGPSVGTHTEPTNASASAVPHPGGRHSGSRVTRWEIATMVAIALAIPACAWLVIVITGRLRRNRPPRSAGAPRDPVRTRGS
jgi:hypothetical protein